MAAATLESTPSAAEASFWSRAHLVATRVRAKDGSEWKVRLDLGLDRFFIPNRARLPARESDPGWELEVAYRRGRSPLPLQLWFDGRPVPIG